MSLNIECEATEDSKHFDWENLTDLLDGIRRVERPENFSEKELFVHKVETTIRYLLEIRENVVREAMKFLSQKQMNILSVEEELVNADPSVEYFGIDWTLLYSRVATLKRLLLPSTSTVRTLEMTSLAAILKILSQTTLELHLHCMTMVIEKKESNLLMNKKDSKLLETMKPSLCKTTSCCIEKGQKESSGIRSKWGLSIQASLKRRPSLSVQKFVFNSIN